MLRVIRILYWLLWWMYAILFLCMIGGTITFLSYRAGNVTFAGGAAIVTCVLIAVTVVSQSREFAFRHAIHGLREQTLASLDCWFKQPHVAALTALERATQEKSNDAEAWVRLALALNILGRPEEALTSSEHALRLDPTSAFGWGRKAGALVRLGRMEEALTACDQALTLDPHDGLAWVNKALLLQRLGRTQEALSAYHQIRPPESDAAFPEQRALLWYIKAAGLHRLERHVEAVEAYDQALTVQPNLTAGWVNKAICLYKLGRIAEARAALHRAKALPG